MDGPRDAPPAAAGSPPHGGAADTPVVCLLGPRQSGKTTLARTLEPTHSERFVALMSKHYPAWREARAELNELPLGAETWKP